MPGSRSRFRALLLAACGALSGVVAAGAGSLTVDERCPDYVHCALGRSPLEWLHAARRTIVFPASCQQTFTVRLKDQFLMKPSAVQQVDCAITALEALDVRVECRAAVGVAYQVAPRPEGPELRVAIGPDLQADRREAPQELTALSVAMAMVEAVRAGGGDGVWVEVPAPAASLPSRLEADDLRRGDDGLQRGGGDDLRRCGGRMANDTSRLLLDTIAFFIEESWAESVSHRDEDSLVIVGRLWDTEAGRGCKGHRVLDIPDWSLEENDKWIDKGIERKQVFYAGARVAEASVCRWRKPEDMGPFRECVLKCTEGKVPSVYQRELCILEDARYVRWGNYLVPPGWSRAPVCRR